MIRRRTFLIGCGGMVAAPAVAQLGLPWTAVAPPVAPVPAAAGPHTFVLRIEGWDAPAEPGATADGEVWVSITQGWRSAWR